jgi:hypothetical protein
MTLTNLYETQAPLVNEPLASDLPEGWVFTKVGEILTVNYGKGLTEAARIPGEVSVYGSNGVVGKHDAALTRSPAIIIGRKGTVGVVHLSTRTCWPIDTTYFIDEFHGLDPAFCAPCAPRPHSQKVPENQHRKRNR